MADFVFESYIAVADKKTQETARDAQSSDNTAVRQTGGLIFSARNLAAGIIERSKDIVTYGLEEAKDAKESGKQMAGDAAGTAQKYGKAAEVRLTCLLRTA